MLNFVHFLSTCRVQPENVWVMAVVGGALLIGGVLSIITGVTYIHRRRTLRDESPFMFWLNVTALLGSGGTFLGLVTICRNA